MIGAWVAGNTGDAKAAALRTFWQAAQVLIAGDAASTNAKAPA